MESAKSLVTDAYGLSDLDVESRAARVRALLEPNSLRFTSSEAIQFVVRKY